MVHKVKKQIKKRILTKEDILKLQYNQIVYDRMGRNADGTPARWVVKGAVKTWKRDPKRFRVPIKRGLYEFWEIVPSNVDRFALTEQEAMLGY